MSYQVLVLEGIVISILFCAFVILSTLRNPLFWFDQYPEAVRNHYIKTHPEFVAPDKENASNARVIEKIIFSIVCLILLVIVMRIAGANDFVHGVLGSYIIWFIVDWIDVFLLDLGILSCWKKIRLDQTEDMDREYKSNSRFHIKGGFIGMAIGVPIALLCGVLVQLSAVWF